MTKTLVVPLYVCACVSPRLSVNCEMLGATSCFLPPDRQGSGVAFPSCVNYTLSFDRCHIRHSTLFPLGLSLPLPFSCR